MTNAMRSHYREREISLEMNSIKLKGSLVVPDRAKGIVIGEKDLLVKEINRQAFDRLSAEKEMVIILEATHLFVEPGALDEVGKSAGQWFSRFLDPQIG